MTHPLRWSENGAPFSELFQDVFFSTSGGAEETQYVFLDHNRLPNRWMGVQGVFRIGELGFGTGLNFLQTLQSWRSRPLTDLGQLEFYSVEANPLSIEALQKLGRKFCADFFKAYAELQPGWNRFECECGAVRLFLFYGQVHDFLDQMSEKMDAWYLDGFSPSKNPEMWSLEVFQKMAHRSEVDATFATYTAASAVRRALQSAGFEVFKDRGFGLKREMLFGQLMSKQGE